MFTVKVVAAVVAKLFDAVTWPDKVLPPTSLDPDIFLLIVKLPELFTTKSDDGLTTNVTGSLAVNWAVVPENPVELSYIAAPDTADSII